MTVGVRAGHSKATRGRSVGRARVSVFIPTYNRSHWLGGAIASVLAQPYAQMRVIVADNASTDRTPDVVRGFDDPRLLYRRQRRHLSLNDHFNRCFEATDTDYLFVLPDDDRMAPGALERTLPVLDADRRVGMVHGQVDVVDASGALIAAGHDMTGLPADAVETGAQFIRRSMRMSYRVHASSALVRTEALSGLRLEEEDYPLTDLGLWMRMALSWDIAFVARTLASYTIHVGSYSAGAADVTAGGYIQTVERILKARDVKLRLLREHGSRLPGARALHAEAERAFRRELLEHAAHETLPERRLRATTTALARSARLDWRVGLEPAGWRLLAGGVLGGNGVSLVKRMLGHEASTEVTA